MKKHLISLFAAFLLGLSALAQAPENIVRWKVAQDGSELVFTGDILRGWHIYGLSDPDNATVIALDEPSLADGAPFAVSKGSILDGREVFFGRAVFRVKLAEEATGEAEAGQSADAGPDSGRAGEAGAGLSAEAGPDSGSAGASGSGRTVRGVVTCQACNDQMCTPPLDWEFEIEVTGGMADESGVREQNRPKTSHPPVEKLGGASKTAENDAALSANEASASAAAKYTAGRDGSAGEASAGSLWALILEAILWGLAMLLTPCVFPMVPMTVSFFLKGESTAAAGRFKALMYGLFIVLLYTVPISIIIILTRAIGGDAVTADIFNWLATHWLPNIIFFIVFMTFAASFFGAFEITLPSKWVNGSDAKAGKGSLGGIFFLALTLVLVSFSCTGPIVGTVLIKSTSGEFWAPMVTMLAFSLAFALPFTLLAMFPDLLKKLPKSGGWLNSVKVCLGFIEVALGLKFLSVADQTYHWGILGRKLYLIIWIVCFTLMGLYLLGVIRFKRDAKLKRLSALRIILSLASFAFVAYLATGLWGAPLKALSGYLPPMEVKSSELPEDAGNKYGLKMPLGLPGYFTLEEGLEAAMAEGKPVFVDVTGHGCVNCREMEQRVWSDPRVLDILRNRYIIVALYNDDKTPLDPSDWVTTESGRVLKDLGRVNSYIARERFGVNAQPNYILLSPDGRQLAPPRGYNLDVEDFLAFLAKGLE